MNVSIRPADYFVIILYLIAMVSIAVYFSRRNKSTEDYFVGDRSFSGWVLGLSMLGTIISSGTFLALPAAAYVSDWRQLSVNLVLPVVAILAIVYFVPFFRARKITSAFEYLEMRYGTVPRLYGMISFVVMQIIRMSQILFLTSLVLEGLTGLPLEWVIVIAGLFVAVYTIVGGIETVIWTDVIQCIVLMIGGVVCFSLIVMDLPEGMSEIYSVGRENYKFSLGSFDWDLSRRTFWTVSILGIVNWLTIYGSDQNLVQRYASAKSTREARKATAIYSMIALPLWMFFFLIGTSLFVYYQAFPDSEIVSLEPDQVLPYFILSKVPVGISGLIIAAVMAAAMSTLDSGVNAISTVMTVDVFKPYLFRNRTDGFYLKMAKLIGILTSILMISGAIVFCNITKESMNDVSLIVTSLFGGCLMGLFMLGFFTVRVGNVPVLIALGMAVCVNIYFGLVSLNLIQPVHSTEIHHYWVGPLVNLVFLLIAYGLSWVIPNRNLQLEGLTVWTSNNEKNNES